MDLVTNTTSKIIQMYYHHMKHIFIISHMSESTLFSRITFYHVKLSTSLTM